MIWPVSGNTQSLGVHIKRCFTGCVTDSTVSVTHGGTYTPDGLTLYVSADLYEEVVTELEAQGIKNYPIQQFSETAVAAAIVIVGFLQANGIGQIAQMIDAISHRHDGKSIRVKIGDDEFEVTGDTHERMAAQLDRLQEKNVAEQHTLGRLGVEPEEDGDSDDGSPSDESGDQTDLLTSTLLSRRLARRRG